jgi:hypothetical protein
MAQWKKMKKNENMKTNEKGWYEWKKIERMIKNDTNEMNEKEWNEWKRMKQIECIKTKRKYANEGNATFLNI